MASSQPRSPTIPCFSVGARYTIGPWKLFGGYEHINYSNPNNPLDPGAFLQGGFIAGAVNNAAFPSDKILQTAWFGVRYAITPALDITGAYYHEWDNTFATAPGTLAGCAVLGSSSSQCAGTLDAVSAVIDWRFARHVDVYAGMMWSQVTGGLANNFFVNNARYDHPGRWKQQVFQLRSGRGSPLPVLS